MQGEPAQVTVAATAGAVDVRGAQQRERQPRQAALQLQGGWPAVARHRVQSGGGMCAARRAAQQKGALIRDVLR